ncbi:MAG: ATP-binding cassette domain-containing protein [Tepidisphaeraceae bacterium]
MSAPVLNEPAVLRYDIRLPATPHVEQDCERVEVTPIVQGQPPRWMELRLHDYERIYDMPGLYEQLFAELLCCVSPQRVVGLLSSTLHDRGTEMRDLRVLDVGAGNGMVGEELARQGVQHLVGIDILDEAARAAARDRPTLYQDYLVADLTNLSDNDVERIAAIKPNCLVTVAALGFGDIPPEAFATAFNQVETGGWVAFNIRDAFLKSTDATGFARLIDLMCERGYLQIEATQRYVHRKSVSGRSIEYVAMVARKLGDLPELLPSDLVSLQRLHHRYTERVPQPPLGLTNSAFVEFKSVSKRFEGQPAPSVDDVTLEISKHEMLAIVGGSGAGKSTLLKMVNGLITPTSGSVCIAGLDLNEVDLVALRRSIGYVFQSIGLFPHMTVAQNVAVVPQLLSTDKSIIRERVDELLTLVSLPAGTYADRKPSDLSGGEQQRVAFARALAAKPRLLLMDEPFGALDPVTRLGLQRQLIQLHRQLKLTSVLVTHDMAEALLLADRIAVMHGGRLIRVGPPSELLRNPGNAYVETLLAAPREAARQIDTLGAGTSAEEARPC